jgi:hypothetical protein
MSLVSIGGSNLGSAGDSFKVSSFTTKASNVLEVIAIRSPVVVVIWIKFETHFAKSVTRYLNYLVRHGPFFIELSQELLPTKQNEQDQ